MPRIVVITDEQMGAALAGPALRAWALAEALSGEHEVAVRSTAGIDVAGLGAVAGNGGSGIDFGDGAALDKDTLENLDRWADVIIFGGYLLVRFPWLRRTTTVLVADLYDPFHLEVLAGFAAATSPASAPPPGASSPTSENPSPDAQIGEARTQVAGETPDGAAGTGYSPPPNDAGTGGDTEAGADPGEGQDAVEMHRLDTTLDALSDQMGRADFMVCASERQRDFWLGHLGAIGRLNPVAQAHDPTFRRMIDVCPFGLGEPATRTGDGFRNRTSGPFGAIGAEDPVVLWGGGVYDWLDASTAIEAVGRLRGEIPGIRLVFLGGAHPTHGESAAFQAAREEAEPLGDTVVFNDAWVRYDQRHNYLLDATVAITTHHEHLETHFAFRTRVLDYLWCGLPMVLSGGDELGDQVQRVGAGAVCPPGDVDAVTDGLRRLLTDNTARAEAATASWELGQSYLWSTALRPLVEFCRDPEPAPDLADERVAAVVARRSRLPGTGVAPLAEVGRDAVRAARVIRNVGAGDLLRRAKDRRK